MARPTRDGHWGVPDPAAVTESDDARRRAFRRAWDTLRQRIELLLTLPVETLDSMAIQRELRAIGQQGSHEQH